MTRSVAARARRILRALLRGARRRWSYVREKVLPAPAGQLPTELAAQVKRLSTGYRDPADIAAIDNRITAHGLHAADERGTLARAAVKVGDLELGRSIAADVVAHGGSSAAAVEVLARANDRLATLQHGWPQSTPRLSHAPDAVPTSPTAVLSVLSQSLPIRGGGYATRSHGLLTSLARRGWDVEAITRLGFPYDRWPADDRRQVRMVDVVDGLSYRRALVPGRRSYPQVPLAAYIAECAQHIADAATSHRAGLVHASSFYGTGLPAADAAAALGVPFIYEMRGTEDLMRSAAYRPYASSSDGRYLIEAESEVCRRADHVLVITDALLEEMVRRGVPREKMTVVPNGVDVADFQPLDRDEGLAAELGLQGRVVIGYVGGFPHYEGLPLLVRAAADLSRRRNDFAVLLVGDGQQDGSLRREVAELGLGDHIRFTGRVPPAEVQRYLSLIDITPFPRLPLEVCELISPMKPFEAMAMGKAVIVSDVAALTQIIEDGVTGVSFAKGDQHALAAALEYLVESSDARARLGSAARSWVQTHGDWAQIAALVDGVYRRFLPGPVGETS